MTQSNFTCLGCGHELPSKFSLRTPDYCYLCDPNITVQELLKDEPIMKNDTSFEVETLTIYYNGDESVGIFTRQYEIKGPFIFEDSEHLEEFKKKLADAFEVVEDGRPNWIMTNVEYEEMEDLADSVRECSRQ